MGRALQRHAGRAPIFWAQGRGGTEGGIVWLSIEPRTALAVEALR